MNKIVKNKGIMIDTSISEDLPTYTQEGIWFLEKLCKNYGAAYNEQMSFIIDGSIDLEALDSSFKAIVDKHTILKSNFIETENGVRTFVKDVHRNIVYFDKFNQYGNAALYKAENEFKRICSIHFDLENENLIKLVVFKISDEKFLLGLIAHHLIVDGWSMKLILSELGENYRRMMDESKKDFSESNNEFSFFKYAQLQREKFDVGFFDEDIIFWKKVLEPASKILELPFDNPRSSKQTFKGSSCFKKIPKINMNIVFENFKSVNKGSNFVVFLSAFALALRHFSGQNNLTIGTNSLNRSELDELKNVGCFVNTIALPFFINDDMTISDVVSTTSEMFINMIKHQKAPYSKVLDALDIETNPSFNSLFQTMITYIGERPDLFLGKDISCSHLIIEKQASKYDLLLYIFEDDDNYEMELEYNSDLFRRETVERILDYYALFLEKILLNNEKAISDIEVLTLKDQKSLIAWNNTTIEFPKKNVIDLFEEKALENPDLIAVRYNDKYLTYGELDKKTNQISNFLLENYQNKHQFVGVFMERSIEMVISLVAIMKTGIAYVPIDPEYPSERISYMINDSKIPVILTQSKFIDHLAEFDADLIDLESKDMTSYSLKKGKQDLRFDSSAYMIYTSGSTGKPKGVVNRHGSLFNRLYWMQQEYQLTDEDRVLQKTPFSFDVSVWEFFWPLMFGAQIIVAEPGGQRDPDYLKELISKEKVTIMHFVPSMLNVFLEETSLKEKCESLRLMFCSGEALPFPTVKKLRDTLNCELYNLYGPTEAAIDVSFWNCQTNYPGNIVPIGKPIANTRLYVLNKNLQPQPIGVHGELYIAGDNLAKGYLNKKELTDKAFIKLDKKILNQFETRIYKTGDLAKILNDGQIQYMGRIDNQVKLRGFRIELGEIEAAIREIEGVKETAVILHEQNNRKILCAYVVANKFSKKNAEDYLLQNLPEYMVPKIFMEVDEIKTTPNGKLDRKALPSPIFNLPEQHGESVETSEAKLLVQIWEEVLSVRNLGLEANFFHLGGDSILSIRVAMKLKKSGYHIEVQDIYSNPTVEALAKLMNKRKIEIKEKNLNAFELLEASDRECLSNQIEDAWPVATLQSGMIYHSMFEENTSVYHDVFVYNIQSRLDKKGFYEALKSVMIKHPQLRSSFNFEDFNVPLQIVHKRVEPFLVFENITDWSLMLQNDRINEWVEKEKYNDFQFEKPSLFRFAVFEKSKDNFSIVFSFHHSILDGWSVSLIISDLLKNYLLVLRGKNIQNDVSDLRYSEYVKLESKAVKNPESLDFWSSSLKHFKPNFFFSTLNGEESRIKTIEISKDRAMVSKIKSLASELNVPLKSFLLSLHVLCLANAFKENKITTGLVMNGRPEILGSDNIAGLFLNTIPFFIDINTTDIKTLAKEVFNFEQLLIPHRRFPLAEMIHQHSAGELFDVAFNFTDFHSFDQSENNIKILDANYFEHTNIPVLVHANHDKFNGNLRFIVNYDESRVEKEKISQYLEMLSNLVDSVPSKVSLFNNENGILSIMHEVLNDTTLNKTTNFVEYGLDSITAIRAVGKIKKLGFKLNIKDIFEYNTIESLSSMLKSRNNDSKDNNPIKQIGKAHVFDGQLMENDSEDIFPVTAMQSYMLEKNLEVCFDSAYHDVFSYKLNLEFDQKNFQQLLIRTVDEYSVLRTSFDIDRSKQFIQRVNKKGSLVFDIIDLSLESNEKQEEIFLEWFEVERKNQFKLGDSPIRFFVHRYKQNQFIFTISFHHAILDGWSLSNLLGEFINNYELLTRSSKNKITFNRTSNFKRFVAQDKLNRMDEIAKKHWLKVTEGMKLNSLDSIKESEPEGKESWIGVSSQIDSNLAAGLQNLSRKIKVPVKQILLSTHIITLSIISGDDDISTGVFNNCREEEEEAYKEIGMFLNFLPFRQKISNISFERFIDNVYKDDLNTLPYRFYPLKNILKDNQTEKLFDSIFNYTKFDSYTKLGKGGNSNSSTLIDVKWFEHTDFLLLVNAGHNLKGDITLTIDTDRKMISNEGARQYIDCFITILEQIILLPSELVGDFIESRMVTQLNK